MGPVSSRSYLRNAAQPVRLSASTAAGTSARSDGDPYGMSPLPCTPMDLDLARFYARKTGPTIDYYRVKIGKPDRGKAMPSRKIPDVNIHHPRLGERRPRPPLIPGGRRGFNEFIPLAEKIAAHGVRVVLHDRRNTGASDVVIQADPSGDLGEEEIWTDDLYELLGRLEARPAVVGGASSGARTSILTYLRHPDAP